jgi:hypothetical protein
MVAIHDHAYETKTHAEQTCNGGLFCSVNEKLAHLSNFIVSEFGLIGWKSSEAQFYRVPHVVRLSSPFEICDGVIGLDGIEVVDLGKIERIRNEGQCHKAVNEKPDSLSIVAQNNTEVFLFTSNISRKSGPDDLFLSSENSSVFIGSDAVNASNSTDVADFVTFTEFGDGDTPPFFDEHNMGPFARSAHIIASFSAHQGE